jgi:hypothetical protein
MTDHRWAVFYPDGHQLAFTAAEAEACSGSGVIRATNADRDVIVLVRGGWSVAVRDDVEVVVTPAPEPPPAVTARPFA